jgi:hypothetical protein
MAIEAELDQPCRGPGRAAHRGDDDIGVQDQAHAES